MCRDDGISSGAADHDRRRGLRPAHRQARTAAALEQLDAIIDRSDGVMVARGDLGLEMPLESVPRVQKEIIRHARARQVPVILATQVLEVDDERGSSDQGRGQRRRQCRGRWRGLRSCWLVMKRPQELFQRDRLQTSTRSFATPNPTAGRRRACSSPKKRTTITAERFAMDRRDARRARRHPAIVAVTRGGQNCAAACGASPDVPIWR